MRNNYNIIIFILSVLILYIYKKKYYKKEHFQVFFSPYYPISPPTQVKFNNYENKIVDSNLHILSSVLNDVKIEANDSNSNYIHFNPTNRPIIKDTLEDSKVKPVTDFLLESINSKLPEGHNLTLIRLEELSKLETETEVKVTFKMISDYKIKNPPGYRFLRQLFTNNESNDNPIIDVEVLSIKTTNLEKLHLNILNLIGLSSHNLPGSNYYEDSNQFIYNNPFTNKLIDDKERNNNDETNNMNEIIPPETSLPTEEDISAADINTEEAESFFDL